MEENLDTKGDHTPKNRGKISKMVPLGVHLCTGQLQRVLLTKPAQPLAWGMVMGEGCWRDRQLLNAQPESILPPLRHKDVFSVNGAPWSYTM